MTNFYYRFVLAVFALMLGAVIMFVSHNEENGLAFAVIADIIIFAFIELCHCEMFFKKYNFVDLAISICASLLSTLAVYGLVA